MPIYEFHCKECRSQFKALRRVESADSVNCPSCGTEKVARLLSVTARSAATEESGSCAMPMGQCCGMPGGCGRPN